MLLDFANGRFEAWGVQPKTYALHGIPPRYYPTSIQDSATVNPAFSYIGGETRHWVDTNKREGP
jgi:hypothetical protein